MEIQYITQPDQAFPIGTATEIETDWWDDWHEHLRDEEALDYTVPATARQFRRSIVMPNLIKPVITVPQALVYRERIRARIPSGSDYEPLMTLYLSPETTRQTVREAAECEFIYAFKYYPANATTNSEGGISDFKTLYPIFDEIQNQNARLNRRLVLCLHGEKLVNNAGREVNAIYREEVFVEEELFPFRSEFPELPTTGEHISTEVFARAIIEMARKYPTAGTVTPHHALANLNHLVGDKLKPEFFSKPLLKLIENQLAILKLSTSGLSCLFIGTDKAPWSRDDKETSCGCAGSYHANPAGLYVDMFESQGALEHLEGFASHHGPDFYGLPRNTRKMRLKRVPHIIPQELPYISRPPIPGFTGLIIKLLRKFPSLAEHLPPTHHTIRPFMAGHPSNWVVM